MGTPSHRESPDFQGDDCTAAVFCGGVSLRMGPLAAVQPKTLLAAYNTPLLWRLIEQLQVAGLGDIVVSTTPRFEEALSQAIGSRARSNGSGSQPRLVCCTEQQNGVLAGFRNVLANSPTDKVLLCLGDIYFLSNPFLSIRAHLSADYDCLAAAAITVAPEVHQGGLILHDNGKIRSVIEPPVDSISGEALRWSGVALVERKRALVDIDAFLADSQPDSRPGDFFEFQRGRGVVVRVIACPDFVNVNSPDHLLLASIYAKLEARGDLDSRTATLSDAATELRLELATQLNHVRQS